MGHTGRSTSGQQRVQEGHYGVRKGMGPGMTVTAWGWPGSWPGQGAPCHLGGSLWSEQRRPGVCPPGAQRGVGRHLVSSVGSQAEVDIQEGPRARGWLLYKVPQKRIVSQSECQKPETCVSARPRSF